MSKMLQNCHLAELIPGVFFKNPVLTEMLTRVFLSGLPNYMINNRAVASAQHTVFPRITAVPRSINRVNLEDNPAKLIRRHRGY